VAIGNSSPVITGQPALGIAANSAYLFLPNASDTDGDALAFSIVNKPAWASFSETSGRLSGTPVSTDAGAYPGIVITVSDGKVSAALPAFSITVSAVPASVPQAVALSWDPPTQNTDGSPLTDLAGYWIYTGTNADNLSRLVQISDPQITQYQVVNLSAGRHYFAITAFNRRGTESALSATGGKTIP
jgi:hypothetical protein